MDWLTISKVGASCIVIAGGVWGVLKGFFSLYHAVRDTKNTVHILATNHLPHLSDAIDKQSVALSDIRSEVKVVQNRLADHVTRFEDTKKFVDKINESLITSAINSIKEK